MTALCCKHKFQVEFIGASKSNCDNFTHLYTLGFEHVHTNPNYMLSLPQCPMARLRAGLFLGMLSARRSGWRAQRGLKQTSQGQNSYSHLKCQCVRISSFGILTICLPKSGPDAVFWANLKLYLSPPLPQHYLDCEGRFILSEFLLKLFKRQDSDRRESEPIT